MGTTPQLLLTVVVTLSVLHMLAPDHWVPITVVGHKQGYPKAKTVLLAVAIGLAHGVTSVVLSLVIAVVGTLFFPTRYVDLFSVVLLLVIALYIVVNARREAKSGGEAAGASVLVSIIPDPALAPFILVAEGFGGLYTYEILGAFVVAAAASAGLVVFLATMGLSRALSLFKPQYVDYLVALALVLVAVFIYFYG